MENTLGKLVTFPGRDRQPGAWFKDSEFAAVEVEELAFALSVFVAAAENCLSRKHVTEYANDVANVEAETFLAVLSTGKARPPLPLHPGATSLTGSFRAIWLEFQQHPLREAICARVLAFYFLTERTGGAVLSEWIEACPGKPESVYLHPAVVDTLASIRLDQTAAILPAQFLRDVRIAASRRTKTT